MKKRRVKRAERNGRSMEAEARAILTEAVEPRVFGDGHALGQEIGGLDIDVPERVDIAGVVDLA